MEMRSMENHNKEIADILEEFKVDLFGVGDMSLYDSALVGIDDKVKEELPFAVFFGLVLSKSILDTITDGPTQLYLHHYRQLNYICFPGKSKRKDTKPCLLPLHRSLTGRNNEVISHIKRSVSLPASAG
jgi:hypothetical protein